MAVLNTTDPLGTGFVWQARWLVQQAHASTPPRASLAALSIKIYNQKHPARRPTRGRCETGQCSEDNAAVHGCRLDHAAAQAAIHVDHWHTLSGRTAVPYIHRLIIDDSSSTHREVGRGRNRIVSAKARPVRSTPPNITCAAVSDPSRADGELMLAAKRGAGWWGANLPSFHSPSAVTRTQCSEPQAQRRKLRAANTHQSQTHASSAPAPRRRSSRPPRTAARLGRMHSERRARRGWGQGAATPSYLWREARADEVQPDHTPRVGDVRTKPQDQHVGRHAVVRATTYAAQERSERIVGSGGHCGRRIVRSCSLVCCCLACRGCRAKVLHHALQVRSSDAAHRPRSHLAPNRSSGQCQPGSPRQRLVTCARGPRGHVVGMHVVTTAQASAPCSPSSTCTSLKQPVYGDEPPTTTMVPSCAHAMCELRAGGASPAGVQALHVQRSGEWGRRSQDATRAGRDVARTRVNDKQRIVQCLFCHVHASEHVHIHPIHCARRRATAGRQSISRQHFAFPSAEC